MRWNDLFADLEGQLSAAASAQFQAEVSELTRAERAAVDLAARGRASRGSDVSVTVRNGEVVTGSLTDAAAQWWLLSDRRRETLVPMDAIVSVVGLSNQAVPLSEVERRLSLGHALRALARDRAKVVMQTDGTEVAGMIGAVGADHCDVLVSRETHAHIAVAFSAIVLVQSAER